MIIRKIPAGMLATNCYIVMDEDTKEAFILDPGGDADIIVSEVQQLNASIKFILLTHGHFDHTGAVIELSNTYKAAIFLNTKDIQYIEAQDQLFIMNAYDPNKIEAIDESKRLLIGNLEIRCIETPGHTPGGVCYLIDNVLFAGDTLFAGSIGRTDFIGGNHGMLLSSIKSKLFVLDEFIIVKPGHGPDTTIGYEKNNNPFFLDIFS
jgi:hydroxyacylglutathione hydrolase